MSDISNDICSLCGGAFYVNDDCYIGVGAIDKGKAVIDIECQCCHPLLPFISLCPDCYLMVRHDRDKNE
jgi:hypothetical protein